MTHYVIGRLGEGGPGIAFTRDLWGLIHIMPQLPAGDYWIAKRERSGEFPHAIGKAKVFSPCEWELDCDEVKAGPGWIIV